MYTDKKPGDKSTPQTKKSDNTTRKLRIGIMGGSFDPIHNGHLVAASEVSYRYNLDKVIFVPTKSSQYKKPELSASTEDRYLMAAIATASNPRFSVSRVDIERSGDFTYTIDTLKDLKKIYPDSEFFFIFSPEPTSQIHKWRNFEELKKLVKFVAVSRPGNSKKDLDSIDCELETLEVPGLDISSTDCRNRLEEGAPVWYLIPEEVIHYIRKNGLYNCKVYQNFGKPVYIDEIEDPES